MNQKPKKLGDVIKKARKLDGEKVEIEDILDEEVEITDFDIRDSLYSSSQYAIIQIRRGDETEIIITGSQPIVTDLEQLDRNELPLLATFRAKRSKAGRTYYCVE